jgi:outer membrane protein assembly factor BamA
MRRAPGLPSRLIGALLWLAPPAAAWSQAPELISVIHFAGNHTTREQILRQEMVVQPGDAVDAARIEQSRQAIMDLGLFSAVEAELQPGARPGERVLLITVKEKYYILPIPKLNQSEEGDIGYGAQLRFDNLAGFNQQLKLTYEQEKTAASSSGEQDVLSLSYVYPRLFGGPWRLDAAASRTRLPIEVLGDDGARDAEYQQSTSEASWTLTRWLDLIGPSRGWRAGGGLAWRSRGYRHLSGTPGLYQDGTAVAATALAEFTDVHNYLWSRGGQTYGVSAEFGLPGLGSDNDYTRQLFYYRGYWPGFGQPHHNFDLQLQLGLSSDRLFGEDAYGLGGGSTLRGYDADRIKGNAFVLANAEYLAPLAGYYPIRGVLFADVGNAFPGNRDIRLSDLKWSVGLGLRWKIKAFVKLDLRVDVAYAVDTGETKVHAGTKETF